MGKTVVMILLQLLTITIGNELKVNLEINEKTVANEKM
jgi:hypothetical protein